MEKIEREEAEKGLWVWVSRNLSPFARITLGLLPIAASVHLIAALSPSAADALNRSVGAAFRFLLAKISGVFPVSLGEALLIGAPFLVLIPVIWSFVINRENAVALRRTFFSLLGVLSLLYVLFVPTLGIAYRTRPLDEQLSLERRAVTAAELYETAAILRKETNALAEEVVSYDRGFTVMPYSFDEMNERLLRAYDSVCREHPFIQKMDTRLKPVGISEVMSYAHITGVYSYMTGEANLNIDFPDFTLPFTAAHELAHQRGIAREDEANFVAFLVCKASDDPYIRYSGYMTMLRYVGNALAGADREAYRVLVSGYAPTILYENIAYAEFYQKYEDSTLGEIAGSVNDAYLQMQGTAGSKSYGMVVDLAVAYYR